MRLVYQSEFTPGEKNRPGGGHFSHDYFNDYGFLYILISALQFLRMYQIS